MFAKERMGLGDFKGRESISETGIWGYPLGYGVVSCHNYGLQPAAAVDINYVCIFFLSRNDSHLVLLCSLVLSK